MLYPKFSNAVKNFVKIKDDVIDGAVFNLHCKLTPLLLFLASAIVTLEVNVGKPIQCISDSAKDQHKVVETYCWITSTFRMIPKQENGDPVRPKSHIPYTAYHGSGDQVYYAYYQWVGFVLFFQAILFYAPKWCWKLNEGKLMKGLLGTEARKYAGNEEREAKSRVLTDYFVQRLKGHRRYAITYWFYEFLCLCNVVFQLMAVDQFLGGRGRFLSYGFNLPFHGASTINAFDASYQMDDVFPLQTKCTFHKYGPSGTMVQYDALCILFLNLYNRYIFAVMWYWFASLLVLLTCLLVHRGLLILSPRLRYVHLREAGMNNADYETNFVARRLPITDFWALYMLKANVDPVLFRGIVVELSRKLAKMSGSGRE